MLKSSNQSQQRAPNKLWSNLFIPLLLFALGFLIFYPALFNFFCADDFIWIKTTRDIFEKQDFTSSDSFAFVRGRPVLNFVFFFLYQIFKLNPFGYHLLSIILHILNVWLLFRLLSFFTDKLILRFTGSLIFLVHFIHEETIFWISSLSTLLCCSFYLTGLLLFLSWRSNGKKWMLYFLSLVFCLLALFSREEAISFPFLILLILLFNFPPVQKLNKLKLLKLSSPFFLCLGFYLIFRFLTLPLGTMNHSYRIDLLILLKNVGYFLVNLVFPYRLLFDLIGYNKLDQLQIYYAGLRYHWLVIPLILLLLYIFFKFFYHHLRKKNVILNCGLVFLSLSTLPYLFLNGNGQRFLYFPLLGFSLICIYFISSISNWFALKGKIYSQRFVYSLLIVIFLLNFIIIRKRSQWWKEAGLVVRNVIQQIETLVPHARQSELYILSLPHRLHGAYIFLTGFEEAVAIYYPKVEGKIKYLGKLTSEELEELSKKLTTDQLYTFDNHKLRKL